MLETSLLTWKPSFLGDKITQVNSNVSKFKMKFPSELFRKPPVLYGKSNLLLFCHIDCKFLGEYPMNQGCILV